MSKKKPGQHVEQAEGVEFCKSEGCKKHSHQFSFCSEHFEWFKFGLITKAGLKVSDFDKKFEHFKDHKKKFVKVA